MKKTGVFIFILVVMVACQKCKKKQPEPDPGFNTEPSADLYAYAYFLPGTYWVYEDSISGIIDSVYITYANKGTYTNGDNEVAQGYPRGTFNWFKCEMISSYDHYKYQNSTDQSWEIYGSVPSVKRMRLIMPGSGFLAGTTINTAITYPGKTLYVGLDYVIYQRYYNSFVVKNKNFSNTQKWFNYKSNCDDDQNTNYYIAKGIGIVRREQTDSNRTWNLVRYNIVQ